MKVRIVLVEPHEAGNLGAAARAMKNFGIHDLWIVGTRPQRIDQVSEWWARGAEDLVNSAQRTPELNEALAGCHLSIATTAVKERRVREHLTPAAAAQLARESLTEDQRVAIVFGREERGLSAGEIAKCQRTASIRTDPSFPTMNLAQSVALFCYELSKEFEKAPVKRSELAAIELLQHLDLHAGHVMEEAGFFHERNRTRVCAELKAIEGRAMLTMREASLLLSLARRIEDRLGLQHTRGSDGRWEV
ncbi:MAG: TrmJ/YjtD family RNA methyltransferase [Thermoanaerobaculia bacterium]